MKTVNNFLTSLQNSFPGNKICDKSTLQWHPFIEMHHASRIHFPTFVLQRVLLRAKDEDRFKLRRTSKTILTHKSSVTSNTNNRCII